MNTRNKKLQKGFYKNLHDFYKSNLVTAKRTVLKEKGLQIKQLIKKLKFEIISRLRSFSKQSLVAAGKIQIDENLFLHLKQEYGFNGRFKNDWLF